MAKIYGDGYIKNIVMEDILHDKKKVIELIDLARPALEDGTPVVIETDISNLDRTTGTMLSYEVSGGTWNTIVFFFYIYSLNIN